MQFFIGIIIMIDQSCPSIQQALAQLMEDYIQHKASSMWVPYDPQWTSICLQMDSLRDGEVSWLPQHNPSPSDFLNLEKALECQIHPSITEFYGCYWSIDLEVHHPQLPITLIQVFNHEDLENLQKNLIGHVLMKRRLKQPITFFIGVTDQDDQMISVINDNGEVWLESVGRVPHLKLAESVSQFIQALSVNP